MTLGGVWMCDMIFPDLQAGFDVTWLISALTNGTLTGVTDGSYNRACNPNICGAEWILMDKGHKFRAETCRCVYRILRLGRLLSRGTPRTERSQRNSIGAHQNRL